MTQDIKELVKRLRCVGLVTKGVFVGDVHAAADALETLAGEVDRLTLNGIHTCHDNCPRLPCVQGREIRALKAERDRLKAALDWALGEGDEWLERKPGEGAFYWRAELRRKALEVKP